MSKKKETEYPVTQEQFEEYVEHVGWFVTFFGLTDWRIEFRHEDYENSRGFCEFSLTARHANIGLTKKMDIPVTTELLRAVAFHETMELQLANMSMLALNRDATRDSWEEETHKVIRRLENCVLPMIVGLYMGDEEEEE